MYAEQYGLLNYLFKEMGFIDSYRAWLAIPETAFGQ